MKVRLTCLVTIKGREHRNSTAIATKQLEIVSEVSLPALPRVGDEFVFGNNSMALSLALFTRNRDRGPEVQHVQWESDLTKKNVLNPVIVLQGLEWGPEPSDLTIYENLESFRQIIIRSVQEDKGTIFLIKEVKK